MPEAMCGLWGSSFCQLLGVFMENFIKAEQPKEGIFFVVGLFSVCDIKKSATLAGFLHKENIRGRWMFPAFFFSDLKGNQSNLASDKISSTSFNREAFRKSSALIINNSSLHFNSPHHPGQTK